MHHFVNNNNSPDAGFSAQKAPKKFSKMRWGSLSAPKDPLAAKMEKNGRKGEGRK